MAHGIFHHDLIEHRTIVQLDEEPIANTALLRVVVLDAEPLVFHTVGLGTEGINAWVGCRSVSAARNVRMREGDVV